MVARSRERGLSTRARALVAGAAVLVFTAEVGGLAGARALVDRHEQVSDLRLDAAMETFRPAPHPGLSKPLGVDAFTVEQNPRAAPTTCAPLITLATGGALDGRSWTGAGDASLVPVTVLTVRFADAGQARAALERKRWAMLRCTEVAVSLPPFDRPATAYRVTGRRWTTSAVGRTARWSLDGGGRRFDFYVARYGNTLTWTYDDDVSSPVAREQVVDDLVDRLRELGRE